MNLLLDHSPVKAEISKNLKVYVLGEKKIHICKLKKKRNHDGK